MWEMVSAIASVVTTVLIAATAVAAMSQLRQLRLASQLEGVLALHREFNSSEMNHVRVYVRDALPERLKDPRFVAALRSGEIDFHEHKELLLANFWEKIGSLVREGVLDPEIYLQIGAYRCVEHWEQLRRVIEIVREKEP